MRTLLTSALATLTVFGLGTLGTPSTAKAQAGTICAPTDTICKHLVNGNDGAGQNPIFVGGRTISIDVVNGACELYLLTGIDLLGGLIAFLDPETLGECVSSVHGALPPGTVRFPD